MASPLRLTLSLCLLGGASCKDAAPDGTPPGNTQAGKAPAEAAAPDDRGAVERLLDWLDPDAVSAAFVRLPEDMDTGAFSVVFALPPRAERLLHDVARIVDDLDAVLPPEAERPPPWLGREAVVFSPVVSAGNYVIRPLRKPRAEVEQAFLAAQFKADDLDGVRILAPRGAFPWKVAFLADDIVAFIPVREIGSGMSPLTAARDLPPSDLEQELRKAVDAQRDTLVELFVQGPVVHLELTQELAGVRLSAKPWREAGIDAGVLMQPTREADQARQALEQRKTPLETDVIQSLVDRVAYTLEDKFVSGRLQLTPDDLRALQEVK